MLVLVECAAFAVRILREGAKRKIMMREEWGEISQRLLKTVGQNNFTTWIEPMVPGDVDDGIAKINVPTNFFGNYVSQNFSDLILHEINASGIAAGRLEFVLQAQRKAQSNTARKTAAPEVKASGEGIKKAGSDMGGIPPLDPRFCFDNFVVGKPNELAHAAARRVAQGGPVTFNPLLLYGGVGLGKTHLMHAMARQLKETNPSLNILFLSAEQFMYRFVQALRDRKMMDFKELFRSVDVLMVDDVQFIAGKDSTQEEFFHTFNALVSENKQIVISADRAPNEIKDLEDRVKSRLQCGLVVDLHPTDYELRLGILQNKLAGHKADHPELVIEEGVLEFLAQRIPSNVRVLEGALTRLFAFASLVGRRIDMDLTEECLSDVLRANDRRLTVEEIQRKVSEHFNIRLSDMVGPKRLRAYARPRQIAMYLCKQLTTRSLPEIGRRFGGRDHTTVIHGVKRIEELRHSDGQIAEDLDLLNRALKS